MKSARYDINAKAAVPLAGKDLWALMVPVLEERFQLRVHRELKEMAVFRLTVAKAGKLPPGEAVCFDPSGPAPPLVRQAPGQRPMLPCNTALPQPKPEGATLWGTKTQVATLAAALTDLLGRPVVDRTGLTGTFDVELSFDRDSAVTLPQRPVTTPPSLPTIATALQEQLGLRLESARDPVEVIVIDRIERPSEN